MKDGYLKLLYTLIISIIIISINIIYRILNLYFITLFMFIFLIFLIIVFKYEKDKEIEKLNVTIQIIIFSGFYIVITYLIGIFTGFLYNGYKLTLLNIIKNIIPIFVYIITKEYIRYMYLIKGSKYKSIIILTTILMILIDISINIRILNVKEIKSIIKFIMVIIFPSISKNILISYITLKISKLPSITYQIIFDIPIYFLPILPDLGIYVKTVLEILFPFLMFLIIGRNINNKSKYTYDNKNNNISYILSFSVLFILILLNSGLLKYYFLTIATGSMTPNIKKGDIVIVEKIKESNLKDLKIGEVLIFKHKEKTVVHRIIDIENLDGRFIFYTKGDFNESPDGYPIEKKDIIGITKVRIPVVGYPAVWFNEKVNK